MCLGEGDTKTWTGRRLRSRDQTNSECGSDLVNILLQILCYPSLIWICFIEKSICGYMFLGKSLLVVLLQKFTLSCGAQAVIWGDTDRNGIPRA